MLVMTKSIVCGLHTSPTLIGGGGKLWIGVDKNIQYPLFADF